MVRLVWFAILMKKNSKKAREDHEGIATYTDFDEFINHEGLEAVFLCNYFHEHTPYAIKALEKNIFLQKKL